MKISKALFVALVSSVAAGSAFAQEAVQAEKVAPIKQLLPNVYGKVELRHSTLRVMEDDTRLSDSPSLSVRPMIGSTFFNERLDTYFILRYTFKPNSNRIARGVTDNESFFTLAKNDLGAIKLYSYTVLADGDSFSEALLGFYNDLSKPVEIVGGKLTFGAYSNPYAGFQSGKTAAKNKVAATDRQSFGLTEEQSKVEAKDATIYNLTGLNVRYAPAAIPGLSFGPSIDVGQKWAPKYDLVASAKEGEYEGKLTGYDANLSTMTRFSVGYKINDTLSFAGQLRHITRGFYEGGVNSTSEDKALGYGKNRFESRLGLTANLF